MKAANVQDEIERRLQEFDSRYIGLPKIDRYIRSLGFGTRQRERLGRQVYTHDIRAVLRQVNRVCAGAAPEVQNIPLGLFFEQRDNLGGWDSGVPAWLD